MAKDPRLNNKIALWSLDTVARAPLQNIGGESGNGSASSQGLAPAWFYSALNWLGKTYYDGANQIQAFGDSLVGSDVDPYSALGSTCLFQITILRGVAFSLALAPDADSMLGADGGYYAKDDAGISELYAALASSAIFSAVRFCYITGLIGPDIGGAPNPNFPANSVTLQSGYDAATGLRVVVQGSAVAQVVPLADFQAVRNEPIYDPAPRIVPIVSALVYDVTQNNQVGAKSFFLPIYYARDGIQGNYYVNKFGNSAGLAAGPAYGQSAVFTGGPGYSDAVGTSLTSQSTIPGTPLTTYKFDVATIRSSVNPGTKVIAGVTTLTYAGASPAALFATQSLLGFYQDNTWLNCLGIPVYDYGVNNGSFTLTASAVQAPSPIYDPAAAFLNGATLPIAVRSLLQASYLCSSSQLASQLTDATTARVSGTGVGLSVMTAALDFQAGTASGAILNELSVPIVATFTTAPVTPPPVLARAQQRRAPAKKAAAKKVAAKKAATKNAATKNAKTTYATRRKSRSAS
jgi:hypothetical protein